jgi:hypothetical protein
MRPIGVLVVVGLFAVDTLAQQVVEVTEVQRRALEQIEAQRLSDLENNLSRRYVPGAALNSECANGDFETGIDLDKWSGADGRVGYDGDPATVQLTSRIFPGNAGGSLASGDSHQALVPTAAYPGPGLDPIVGITQVAPGGSTKAVRIGNSAPGGGVELLAKTFVVQADRPIIGFRYAAVLELPLNHAPHQRPSFRVRVLAGGQEIPNIVNLGNGSNELIAGDRRVLRPYSPKGPDFTDWTCAQINLSCLIGKTVTVELIVEDCTLLGHYGYAYVDDFCSTCEGPVPACPSLVFEPAASTNCGPGQLCFVYTLGPAESVSVQLNILQNGVRKTETRSGLTSETPVCFDIVPALIPGLAPGLASFQYEAIATFKNGDSDTTQSVRGEYAVDCGCRGGPNLIANGDFEKGNEGFTSAYTLAVPPLPGHYAITDLTEQPFSPCWTACSGNGHVLAINGATGRPGSRLVWSSQAIPVVEEREYEFCAKLRGLPQPALDFKPKISIRFVGAGDIVGVTPAETCSGSITHVVRIPDGVVWLTVEILLDEGKAGDGNDFAIDDISLEPL